jgi:S1-C subfamily serine protease
VGNRTLIKEAVLGSSVKTIVTGAPVIAIGSPTGVPGSVIYGNVTSADESLELPDNDLCRLSTDIYGSNDATGFLINLDGAVIGMIDMSYRDSSIPNMLCAVGISELRPIIHRMESGKTKAFLGVSGIDVTSEISEANSIPIGVWVTHVEEDSPAMAAGIQKGDVITGFDKNDILHMAGLIVKLEETEPGQNVNLRIMRRNGGSFEEIKVNVTTQ